MEDFLKEMLAQQKSSVDETKSFEGMMTRCAKVKMRDEEGNMVESKQPMLHVKLNSGELLRRYVFPEVFPGGVVPVVDKPIKVTVEVVKSSWVDPTTGEERSAWNVQQVFYDMRELAPAAAAMMSGGKITVTF